MDALERDQLFVAWRLIADEYFSDVAVLIEDRGDITADIEQSLSVLNERTGKLGACAVVLMPELTSESPDAPGPRSLVRVTVQVIEMPLLNRGAAGSNKTASEIAERVRRILHHFSTGRGSVFSLASQAPLPVEDGKVSLGVAITRPNTDLPASKVAKVKIEASSPTVPSTLTLSTSTPAAAIYYTTDGSYPSPANPAALLYAGPTEITEAAVINAAAQATGFFQSDITFLALAA